MFALRHTLIQLWKVGLTLVNDHYITTTSIVHGGVRPATISLVLLLWEQYLLCQNRKGTFKSPFYGHILTVIMLLIFGKRLSQQTRLTKYILPFVKGIFFLLELLILTAFFLIYF